MFRMTITSFQPFSIECEEIQQCKEGLPKQVTHAAPAQIYKNSFYLFLATRPRPLMYENELWSFDLNNLIWRKHSTSETFKGLHAQSMQADSFIYQDDLYIYGGKSLGSDQNKKEIIKINLNSLDWSILQQPEEFINKNISIWSHQKLSGVIYQNYLLILGTERFTDKSSHIVLNCWNINSNSWSTFRTTGLETRFGDLLVSNNLLVFAGKEYQKDFLIAVLNLEKSNLETPKTPEEQNFKALFMNEKESDIIFQVQDKTFPAHKHVLIQKSKYFANLFNSGMVESRQDVIEIQECDDLTFQEFLRWIYCKELTDDVDCVIELMYFSEKYLQNDLLEKCMNYLKYGINSDNVFTIREFAREENLAVLRECCMQFFKNHTNLDNVSTLIKYLDEQHPPEFASENLELQEKALSFVMDNYRELCLEEKENSQFYENFLIKNLNLNNITRFADFLCNGGKEREGSMFTAPPKNYSKKFDFEKESRRLTAWVSDFARMNYHEITKQGLEKSFPNEFVLKLLSFVNERLWTYENSSNYVLSHGIPENKGSVDQNSKSNGKTKYGRKRKEPIQKDGSEENSILKKTKTTSP